MTLVDTGKNSMTGGRLLRIKKYINNDQFCLTYGDGLSNIDLNKLVEFHNSHSKLATITAVKTPGRWGSLNIKDKKAPAFLF